MIKAHSFGTCKHLGDVVEDKWGGVYVLIGHDHVNNETVWAALVLCPQNDGMSAGMNPAGGIDALAMPWVEKNTWKLT